MKIELKYNDKKYMLETQEISAEIKAKVRELEIKYSELRRQNIMNKLQTGNITSLSFEETYVMGRYFKTYPGGEVPIESLPEIKPMLKKLESEVDDEIEPFYLCGLAQIMLDSSKLGEEVKSLFNSEWSSDFWMKQSLEKLGELSDYFRKRRTQAR